MIPTPVIFLALALLLFFCVAFFDYPTIEP